MIKKKNKINSCFVLGSTSDVAIAITEELAKNGCKKFHLLARDLSRNKKLLERLNSYYKCDVIETKIELSDYQNLDSLNQEISNYDLYLITVGKLCDSSKEIINIQESLKIASVNYFSLIPWILKIVTPSRLKLKSRLWIFSSVAADLGRPSNYQYGAAKSGITTFCEGLLHKCNKKPFSIRIIKAGFLSTRMSEGKAPKVLSASTSSLAKNLLKNPNKRGIEYYPWWWGAIMFLIKKLPSSLISKL